MISCRAVIAYFLVATAAPAGAQPAVVTAQELYDRGRDLMAGGKITEACAAFEQSHRLDPAVTTIIALATCRERNGQLANARELFLEAEQQTRSASDHVTAQLHKIARERAAKLESRVSKLTIRVPDTSTIDGLEIWRDTMIIPAAKWNLAIPLDGGTYTIIARAPGVREWSTSVTLAAESDLETVDVPDLRTLERGRAEAAKVPPADEPVTGPPPATPAGGASDTGTGAGPSSKPAEPPETPQVARPGRSLAPIAIGAGAVVLLGGALGVSLWGDSTYDAAKAEMTDQTRRDSLYDSANRKRYAAQGFAVAGVGCAGVAVWLYLRQRGARAEATTRAARLMLAPTASGIGVAGQF